MLTGKCEKIVVRRVLSHLREKATVVRGHSVALVSRILGKESAGSIVAAADGAADDAVLRKLHLRKAGLGKGRHGTAGLRVGAPGAHLRERVLRRHLARLAAVVVLGKPVGLRLLLRVPTSRLGRRRPWKCQHLRSTINLMTLLLAF